MEKRALGSLQVSLIGVGCNNFGREIDSPRAAEVVHKALDVGINFFDTADVYGGTRSEELLGKALGARRAEAVVATKFGQLIDDPASRDASADYARAAADRSLRRLGTEYIDLLQLHHPDPRTPIAETLGALGELVFQGKVIEIGCSNFSVDELRQAASVLRPTDPGFASVQNEYSLINRGAELDVLPYCEKTGMAFLPYLPLFHGLLTGKYRRGQPPPPGSRVAARLSDRRDVILSDENFDTVDRLALFAEASGRTLLELAFAWLLARPAVASVIAGATSSSQVEANASCAAWVLSADELVVVEGLARAEQTTKERTTKERP